MSENRSSEDVERAADRERVLAERKERKQQAKLQEVSSAKAAGAPQKMRILALHGGMQCGASLRSGQMKKMERWLKDVAEFSFVDAPFTARWPSEDAGCANGEQAARHRSWWRWNDLNPDDDRYAVNGHEQDATFYHGIETSLAVLWDNWCASGGFDGIIGFSQGAIVASLFANWMRRRYFARSDS